MANNRRQNDGKDDRRTVVTRRRIENERKAWKRQLHQLHPRLKCHRRPRQSLKVAQKPDNGKWNPLRTLKCLVFTIRDLQKRLRNSLGMFCACLLPFFPYYFRYRFIRNQLVSYICLQNARVHCARVEYLRAHLSSSFLWWNYPFASSFSALSEVLFCFCDEVRFVFWYRQELGLEIFH